MHKITVTSGDAPDNTGFNIVRGDVTGIVSANASKLTGILRICEELGLLSGNIAVVGNSENDVPMLDYFHNSIAVSGSDRSAKRAARFICGVSQILDVLK